MFKIVSSIEEQSLQQDIQFLYDLLDRNSLFLIEEITNKIYDFQTANLAKKKYDKDWFCNLLSSTDLKIKIATLLKNLCSKYKVSSLVWDSIVDESTSILTQIDILQNKNNFKRNFEG